jgi:hypothetical protein
MKNDTVILARANQTGYLGEGLEEYILLVDGSDLPCA